MKIEHAMSGNATRKRATGLKNRLARSLLHYGRMKKTSNRNGSVLMEYLVVLVFVGAALMAASAKSFYSHVSKGYAGDPRVDPKGFGELGLKFVGFYQRTSGGLSLPVP